MEKRFKVLPCGHKILLVQIAIAIPSLSAAEKDADLPPRFKEAGRKSLEIFLTQLAKRSACVDICQYRRKKPY